ncbi:MAG TPA: hypothetical protein DIV79_13250 [Opitutae bacterium]|nr:hypothetical protein [Opitutaceae bacterium]HCR30973.1 hypothetical protein [Opitutae bacterium]
MTISNRIRGITFDAAGTLFFPTPSVGAIYSEVMARFGLNLEPAQLEYSFRNVFKSATKDLSIGDPEMREREFWRSVVTQIIEELAEIPNDLEDLFDALWLEFASGSRWKLNPDAPAIFDFLENRGISFALLTNWDRRVRQVVCDHRLDSKFSHLFISSEAGFEKPDRRFFDLAAAKMKLFPQELLHIGDHHKQDFLGARNSGWNALLLAVNHDSDPSANRIKSLYEIQDLL